MSEARKIEIVSEIRIEAPPERVWKAVTDEQMDWYPYSYGQARTKRIVCDGTVGGHMWEDWGDGAGYLYNTITYWDPPKGVGTRGYLQGAITLEQWMQLVPEDDATVLKTTTITYGAIDDEMAEGIRTHGDLSLHADALRAWIERGEKVTRT